MIRVRPANRSEMEWVNKCYCEVEFMHSNFDKETIAIAEVKGEKAGLGRLVTIDEHNLELAGMYVFEAFRGQGVARAIVQFLLQHRLSSQTVYCIPFEHLVSFYNQFGFVPCNNLEQVPQEFTKKILWCQEKYPNPTALLINPHFSAA